ncbi:unnamed protein product, partial [Musa textilis]
MWIMLLMSEVGKRLTELKWLSSSHQTGNRIQMKPHHHHQLCALRPQWQKHRRSWIHGVMLRVGPAGSQPLGALHHLCHLLVHRSRRQRHLLSLLRDSRAITGRRHPRREKPGLCRVSDEEEQQQQQQQSSNSK